MTNQYSLPVVPFLFVAVISALAARQNWLRSRRLILGWSVVSFLLFAHYWRLVDYVAAADTAPAARAAIAQVPPEGVVLSDPCLGAHLAQRRGLIVLGDRVTPDAPTVPDDVEYILFNLRHPCSLDAGWLETWSANLTAHENFSEVFSRDGLVVLHRLRREAAPPRA